MSAVAWLVTLVAMALGLGFAALWIADGGRVEQTPMCGEMHPLLKQPCTRGVDHDAIDVHRTAGGAVWFDGDDDPIRSCVDDTDWRGKWQ